MINKTWKNHKLVLVTERIFCNNPKANAKKEPGDAYYIHKIIHIKTTTAAVYKVYKEKRMQTPLIKGTAMY